jgi:hypothetical protein
MILNNKSTAFDLTFNGADVCVPVGRFEVNDKVGPHILDIAKKWKKDVENESVAVAATPNGIRSLPPTEKDLEKDPEKKESPNVAKRLDAAKKDDKKKDKK